MSTIKEYPPTPELDRLKDVAPDSQKLGEFIDWLEENGLFLCSVHRHTDDCRRGGGPPRCELHDFEHIRTNKTVTQLLAEYFSIDLNKVETERRTLLDFVRRAQES